MKSIIKCYNCKKNNAKFCGRNKEKEELYYYCKKCKDIAIIKEYK